jgi:predicted DNA-binding transcriptional regulator YafY
MKLFNMLERLDKLINLINNENTGTPREFAQMLGICESHLYNHINELKIIGAPISYSRKRCTYHYDNEEFEMNIFYCLTTKDKNGSKIIFGKKVK